MIDSIKRLFINYKKGYFFNSCEEIELLDMTNIEIVGHIVDCSEGYFTMVSTDYTYYELYLSNRRLPTPELNGFYQCKGAFIDREDGRRVFAVESIKKLERGSKELEEKIPQEDYSEVQKLLHNSADVSSLFSFKELFNHPINGLLCPEIVNNETVHDLNASEETITNEPDLNCTLKQDNYYPNSKENEPLKVENNEIVPAIILSIDNLKNIAMLFVPGRNTPFVKVPLKFLEAPFKIGQFYSIKLPNVKQSKYTSIYYNNFAKVWKETPPIKTRISSDGTIQFHICALLDKRTENGFSCFKSKNFPLVIDSSCLFNHYNINGKMSIKKVKFWCSLRKIPIAGIYWKIVKIDKKFKKEIISFIDERQNEEEKLKRKKEEEEVKKKEEIKKKLEKEKIQQIIKQQQQQKTIKEKIEKNENECFNGFVCAQLLNEYIIYLPEEKEYAYLLIKSKMDKLLGLWLQIQIRYLNEKLMVERFFVVESKILSIVSNKRAMFKSKIEIPSLNDPTETLPFCTTLGIYLNDNHNLIQNKHRGRCVNGTIGVKPLENEESLIQWEILHIMEH